jgi:hypothetical protein
MNQQDKAKHIESIQKEITSVCFEACFNPKKFVVEKTCV